MNPFKLAPTRSQGRPENMPAAAIDDAALASAGMLPRLMFLALAALAAATGIRAQSDYATPYTFTTLAGAAGEPGYVFGTGLNARMKNPLGVAVDSSGNLYVADTGSETIMKISSAGVVTPFSGVPLDLQATPSFVDGPPNSAQFEGLEGICIDASGTLYVTDSAFVRMISSTGVVTTLAGGGEDTNPSASGDGVGNQATFGSPQGIAADNKGNLFVADSTNNTIREVDIATTRVSTIAGFAPLFGSTDGTGSAARFSLPYGVAVDSSGNVYVADRGDYTIRMITPAAVVTTLAGSSGSIGSADGTGAAAQFYSLNAIAVDAGGNLYVTEANNTIRKITSAGAVTTLAGTSNTGGSSNGTGAAALFNDPYGVAVDTAGDMFVADINNDTIRERYAAPNSAPSITTQPAGQSVAIGASATFTVAASGVPVPSYQWLLDGSYVPGGTNPTLTIENVQASNLGSYSVIITNSGGVVTSSSATLSSPGVTPTAPTGPSQSFFSNISTRAQVGTGAGIEIAGFVVSGPPGSTEQLLLRADGYSLLQFQISGYLLQPVLTLFDSSGAQIATNSSWSASSNSAQIASAAASVGAFAFTAPDASFGVDSALLLNLPPGAYTAQISGMGGTTGISLAEIYQVGSGPAQLTNISTRADVGSGALVEIAGLVVQGAQPAQVLIRAVGPTLSTFNVSGVLAQPTLTVVDAAGDTVATNTGWSTNANAAAIASTASSVGAFALPAGSADCALLLTLQPGAYTAIVSGVGGTSGVALVEAYQVP
jgi:sugar lactone lactonase YvrE